VRVAFDTAPVSLNNAGERRSARALLQALKARRDLEVVPISLTPRVPRSFAQRLVWQAVAEAIYYPVLAGRKVRAAHAQLLHQPRQLVPPDLGIDVPRVVTVHDVLALRMPEHFTRLIADRYRWLARSIVRRADRVITPSRASRDDVVELLGAEPERVRVTPWGVEERFRPRETEADVLRRRFGFDPPFVACVGTLEPRKNLSGAVQAFERIQQQFPDHTLVIVGGRGWKAGELERLLAGTAARVERTGYLPDEDLPFIYSAADCFLFPSHGEGFGFPVLEAMACGTAVIAGDNTSLPEVAGDAALLVDSRSVDELADALASVLESSELRDRLGRKGLERSRDFTWERCAEATVAVYRELVGV
jgi:glycosyltransferase involved in cell wall biosynthesis